MALDTKIVCCFLHPITKYGYPPAADDTVRFLNEMRDLGFRSVELEGIHEQHLGQVSERRNEIAAEVRRLELAVPYFCVVLPGLSSADPDERQHNLDLFGKGCEVARLLGAAGVLDNAPIPPYRFPEGLPVTRHYDEDVLRNASLPDDLEWPEYWDNLTSTFSAACDIADGYGLTYQIHPCYGALASTADAFLNFREAVGRDNLRLNLDTANQFALRDNLPLAVRRLAGYVDYIHLSDNRGQKIEHLVPGDGAIDWDSFFESLRLTGFQGHIGIDVGGAESDIGDIDDAYRTSAEWLTNRWLGNE